MSDTPRAPSAFQIERAMSAVAQLKAQLAGYDDDAILSAIDSETNALELIDSLAERVIADQTLVEVGEARLRRVEARVDRRRMILKAMMEEIGPTLERPLATLSLGTGPGSAVITDAKTVPEVYWRRSIDKVELLRALKKGAVHGAELTNGATVLTIRSK
jgi:Siphovirus Gp157